MLPIKLFLIVLIFWAIGNRLLKRMDEGVWWDSKPKPKFGPKQSHKQARPKQHKSSKS